MSADWTTDDPECVVKNCNAIRFDDFPIGATSIFCRPHLIAFVQADEFCVICGESHCPTCGMTKAVGSGHPERCMGDIEITLTNS